MARTVAELGIHQHDANSEHPQVGLETLVLKVWLENSPPLRRAFKESPRNRGRVKNAVRLAVDEAFALKLDNRSQGLTPEEARELTRPAMWTPPTWPSLTTSAKCSTSPASVPPHIATAIRQFLL
jgi:hypothetical protein